MAAFQKTKELKYIAEIPALGLKFPVSITSLEHPENGVRTVEMSYQTVEARPIAVIRIPKVEYVPVIASIKLPIKRSIFQKIFNDMLHTASQSRK